ncbi:alpha/beta fold hydrolase [Pontibacter litorisediminis]|uniref:alpha/beta fold hydrolase n=1 Tax=Pontibacter litorisediminis TaxID=1846260 RepID=UPI0023EB8F00|nr:alpha/beta hydrolase [Pontibacter litorisediminis]
MLQEEISTITDVNGQGLYVEYRRQCAFCPTIVFLHDSLGCVQLWRDLPQKLAEATDCNVLAYDRLGYGKSDPMPTHERPTNYLELEAAVLNDLLKTLNIEDAILFGHSDGGSIALIAASKYPKRVKAVVCEAAHIFVEDVTLEGVNQAVESYRTTNLSERLKRYHGDKVEAIFRAWTETWTRGDYRNWNIEHFLPGISCPLLFVQGSLDEYGTVEQVERTVKQVSGRAEKYIIPGVGHTPHRQCPELVISRASAFIKQLLDA